MPAVPRHEPAEPIDLRILNGPNVYFPRPALKVVLDAAPLLGLSLAEAADVSHQLGLLGSRPGTPGSGQRLRWAARVVVTLARRVAAGAGTTRLGVRVRPGPGEGQLVLACPWRRRGRAEAFGHALAGVVLAVAGGDVTSAMARAAVAVAAAAPGDPPDVLRPAVPVVAVTGTNGKTTTTRLIAHMGGCAGRRVGWSDTDGIHLDGRLVDAGDWSGPGGARRVLAEPGLGLAVLETARGGILLRGIGVTHNDVAVVTNVSADHLGLHGIRTLDELAEVKATIVRITKPDGWVVLNGDDPRVAAMGSLTRARPWVFSLDPEAPALRAALSVGGRGMTVLDGAVAARYGGSDLDELVPVVDVPLTLAGLSSYGTANALAATAAALAVGLPRAAVVDGLRTFRPDPEHNPGRMNLYDLLGATVVVDLAHNEDGLAALLEVARGLVVSPGRLTTVLGTAGDRRDEDLRAIGRRGALGSDLVAVAAKPKYLRGRPAGETEALIRAGAAEAGAVDPPTYADELTALRALLDAIRPGDVLALMCQAQRAEVAAELESRAASVLRPADIGARLLRTRR